MYDLQHIVYATLRQIESAIQQIQIWNVNIGCADDYLTSNDGMKTLAATSMMIEAIGEGVKKIDNKTDGRFLINKPEIPWQEIKKIRNFLAHGYFDVDADQIYDIVSTELEPLKLAILDLIDILEQKGL